MQHWKAILAYDGSPYHGWQVQPDRTTVQGTLAHALHHLTGETVLPQGSGRTDTGVHALAQVASFTLNTPIPTRNLHHALNRVLPPSIRVLSLSEAPADFHARHSALRKSYEYRILPRTTELETICSPFLAPYVWVCPRFLDLDLLNQAAAHVLGTHDFTSFAAVNPDQAHRHPNREELQIQEDGGEDRVPQVEPHHGLTWGISPSTPNPNTRTIYASHWHLDETHTPPILRYLVTGSGFLHHMVRNLVGTFVEAGSRRLDPNEIPTILAARNRCAAGPTAPARGLFLKEVEY